MKSIISFTVVGRPQPQGSSRAFVPKGWIRPVITSANPKLKGWRQIVAAVAQRYAPETLFTGAVKLTLLFYLKRPVSLPKKVTAMVKKPDTDKLVRACCDALEGIMYVRDSQITWIFAAKSYTCVGHPERVEIRIEGAVAERIDRAKVGKKPSPPWCR